MQRKACAAQESTSDLLVLKREAEETSRCICVQLQKVIFTHLSPHIDHLLPNTPEELGL